MLYVQQQGKGRNSADSSNTIVRMNAENAGISANSVVAEIETKELMGLYRSVELSNRMNWNCVQVVRLLLPQGITSFCVLL